MWAPAQAPTSRATGQSRPSNRQRRCAPNAPRLPPAVDAVAEELPFEDSSFEASMAIFTVHQWQDLDAGLAELRRVTAGPVVILTCDPAADRFCLNEYAPEVISAMTRRNPPIRLLTEALGARSGARPVPIPLDCTDGFCEAYYGRPEGLCSTRALGRPARRGASLTTVSSPGSRVVSLPTWSPVDGTRGTESCGPCPSSMVLFV
jgi:hypothetical protein